MLVLPRLCTCVTEGTYELRCVTLTKSKLELAQVFRLNWSEGLHLDLVVIKPCEVNCAWGIPTHRSMSWISVTLGSNTEKKKTNPSRLNLTIGPYVM